MSFFFFFFGSVVSVYWQTGKLSALICRLRTFCTEVLPHMMAEDQSAESTALVKCAASPMKRTSILTMGTVLELFSTVSVHYSHWTHHVYSPNPLSAVL